MQKPELKGPSWCHERVHPFDPASLFPLKSLTWGGNTPPILVCRVQHRIWHQAKDHAFPIPAENKGCEEQSLKD